jgi:hypothetical protein
MPSPEIPPTVSEASPAAVSRRPRTWQRVAGPCVTCPACGSVIAVGPADRNGWRLVHSCPPAGLIELHAKRQGAVPWAWRFAGGYGAG